MFKLLRIKDWIKNLFIFLPVFFAGDLFINNIYFLILPFFSFCFFASAVYIINDVNDVELDRLHPVKCKRPIACRKISVPAAISAAIILLLLGTALAFFADKTLHLLIVLLIYLILNVGYSFGLKKIGILDIIILSSGFVLRVKAGSIVAGVPLSEWLIVMVFLLAMFMSIAKRRDDVMLKLSTGKVMRESINGYTVEYLNILLALFSAIIIVAYIMYTISSEVERRMGTNTVYYTCVFVIAGILRYLQIALVLNQAGSPTEILYKDRFVQITIFLWIVAFYTILYLKKS
jgi:4-hydroxybenzoate polyprenyltransferase